MEAIAHALADNLFYVLIFLAIVIGMIVRAITAVVTNAARERSRQIKTDQAVAERALDAGHERVEHFVQIQKRRRFNPLWFRDRPGLKTMVAASDSLATRRSSVVSTRSLS